MDWLPAARRVPHGAVLPIAVRTHPKCAIHTTETPSWPGYAGWTIPPHVTVLPRPGVGVEVEQHIPFGLASFALENAAGGVETNRADVAQVELIGSCDPKQKGRMYYWPEADDAVLRDLFAKVIQPISVGLGIPLRALRWVAFPDSYGAGNGVRLQGAAWLAYSGFLGHEHAAENHHGDPGLFPWDRMIQLSQQEDDMTPEQVAAAVWGAAMPVPPEGGKPVNAQTVLGRLYMGQLSVAEIVDGLAKGPGGADPAEIADAVVAHFGADVAKTLVDEIAKRLQGR